MNKETKEKLMKDFSNEIKERVENSPYIYCIKKTCDSCPEQYDVYNESGFVIAYIRLRWHCLTCCCPEVLGQYVYSENLENDGIFGNFNNNEERNKYLIDIIDAIDQFYHDNTVRYIGEYNEHYLEFSLCGNVEHVNPSILPVLTKLMEYEKKAPLPIMLPSEPSATLEKMMNAYTFLTECKSTTPEALRGARNLINIICQRLDIEDEHVPNFEYDVDSTIKINE